MRNILLIFVFFILPSTSNGQPVQGTPLDHFCRLTKENGLAGESVSNMITDHTGLVWIATSNGVSCYNGCNLVSFTIPSTSHTRTYVYDICEDDEKNIYVATEVGVYCLRNGNNSFERIMPELERAETILASHGILYVGNGDGLWVTDGKSLSSVKVGNAPTGLENSVRDIQQGEDGTIWFLSRYALNSYNPSTRKHESIVLSQYVPDGAAFGRLAILGKRFLISSKNNGLFVYDPSDTLRPITHIEDVGNVINSVKVTPKGQVCIGTDGAGAVLLDGNSLQPVERFSTVAPDAAHQIPTEGAYFYYRDANNVDWFGFYRHGAMHSWYSGNFFRQYACGQFSAQGMEVRSFLIEPTLKVLGTNRGIFFIDEQSGTVRSIDHEQLDGMHIITSIVRFGSYIYAASYDAGVRRIDPHTLQMSRLPADVLLSTATVSNLAVSPQGELWMLTGEGVYVMDDKGNIRRYTEHNSKLKGGSVRDVRFDSHGNGWVVTGNGLSIYVASTRQFENSNLPNGFLDNIRNLSISHSPSDTLIFYRGTNFYYTDEQMKHYGTLSMPVSGERSSGILSDGKSYWIATENGLVRISHDKLTLRHYGYAEGLSSKFITSLVLKERNQLWVGTYNGLFMANTDSLLQADDNYSRHIMIYNILRGGQALTWSEQRQANISHSLPVAWNISSQQISLFATLPDYAQPIGRQYEWRLDDEKEWNGFDDNKPLHLSLLSLGNHRLELRLAGVPSSLTVVTLEVRPSAMAYIEFLVVVLLIVVFAFLKRMHSQKKLLISERNDMEEALIEMETEAEKALAQSEETAETKEKEKYEKVRINEEECAMIADKIKTYLETEKVYTNAELKMKDVADHLHLSSSKLSQVFNLYLGENYYEFINRYRLEEFKRLIGEGQYKRFTITALSEQCGFKKSSFFSTFRRIEGMTPAEYLKKHGAI